jgi:hypothetical protein
MKIKPLPQDQVAELMMICGAIHDLAEIVSPDKASHLHIIQLKLERIIAVQAGKPSISKLLNSIDSQLTTSPFTIHHSPLAVASH